MTTPLFAIVGEAGSGKDTTARMICQKLPRVQTLALADPLKTLCNQVFCFSQAQLYGPSEMRNAPDPYLSYPDFSWRRPFHYLGGRRDAKELRSYVWPRAHLYFQLWLDEVLPPGVDHEVALLRLRCWLSDVMARKQITPRYALQTLGTEFGRSLDKEIWVKYAQKVIRDREAIGTGTILTDARFANEIQAVKRMGGVVLRVVGGKSNPAATASAGAGANHASEAEQRDPALEALIDQTLMNTGTLEDLEKLVEKVIFDLGRF